MTRPENVKCATCIYYLAGVCYLLPPSIHVVKNGDKEDQIVVMRPGITTPEKDFCGEWSDTWEDTELEVTDLPPLPRLG